MESMQCSPYMASRPKFWTHEGKERLRFLPKMGVSLKEANTAYVSTNSDLCDSSARQFDTQCDSQCLAGGHFASVLLRRYFAAHLATGDVVYSVRARLSSSDDYSAVFGEIFSVVRMAGNQTLLNDGADRAKIRARVVINLGPESTNRKNTSIVNSGGFRITYIHNSSEKVYLLKHLL